MFSFKAIIASTRYHVYKETSRSNIKMNVEVKVELESLSTYPYACVIKAEHSYFIEWKTVTQFHVKFLAVYFLLKE